MRYLPPPPPGPDQSPANALDPPEPPRKPLVGGPKPPGTTRQGPLPPVKAAPPGGPMRPPGTGGIRPPVPPPPQMLSPGNPAGATPPQVGNTRQAPLPPSKAPVGTGGVVKPMPVVQQTGGGNSGIAGPGAVMFSGAQGAGGPEPVLAGRGGAHPPAPPPPQHAPPPATPRAQVQQQGAVPAPVRQAPQTPNAPGNVTNTAENSPQYMAFLDMWKRRQAELEGREGKSDPNLDLQIKRLEERLSSDNTERMMGRASSRIADAAEGARIAGGQRAAEMGRAGLGTELMNRGIDESAQRAKAGASADIELARARDLDALTIAGQRIMEAPGQMAFMKEQALNQYGLAGLAGINSMTGANLADRGLNLQQMGLGNAFNLAQAQMGNNQSQFQANLDMQRAQMQAEQERWKQQMAMQQQAQQMAQWQALANMGQFAPQNINIPGTGGAGSATWPPSAPAGHGGMPATQPTATWPPTAPVRTTESSGGTRPPAGWPPPPPAGWPPPPGAPNWSNHGTWR